MTVDRSTRGILFGVFKSVKEIHIGRSSRCVDAHAKACETRPDV